jgi:type IV pilus assembly protein PilE
MHGRSSGFTLVELMITVVVVAILASIAVPSYRDYVMRSQRTDARSALLRVQASEEKFFLQNNTYTPDVAAAPPAGLGLSTGSEHGYYGVAVVLSDGGMGYTATATPVSGKGQDLDTKCTAFSINHTGQKTATGTATNPSEYCWR